MNTAGNFDLSVIIPTYKRKDSLFTLLECLLRQQNVNLQIIVVDQNPPGYFSESEENIFAQVNKIWQEDPNASKARNIGFLNSSAPYVLFIDDDLIPEDDFCSKGVNIFYQNRNIGCYFPNVYNELGPEVSLRDASTKAIGNIGEVFEISDAISAAVFFERSYYEKSGGFDPYLFEFAKTAEDQEFFIRMKRKGLKLWFAATINVYHDENVSGGCELRTADYWKTREKCILSWTLRYRVHNRQKGKLSAGDFIKLCRSAFINRQVLTSGVSDMRRNIRLLFNAISKSNKFYQLHEKNYRQSTTGFLNSNESLLKAEVTEG